VPRGEEEAGVVGQRERRNRLGVAVYGLPDCGGVGGRHQPHLPAAGAREERLLLRGGLSLAARGAPQRERAARVELLQRAAAAVVLLERRRRSHREAAVGRRSLGFCGGGAGGGREGLRSRAGQGAGVALAVLGKRIRDSVRLSLACGTRRL
jgi:hypothetical protein